LSFDRRAFLHWLRNVPRGLRARSRIVTTLEASGNMTVSSVAEQVALDYSTVLYHLHNMKREGVVERNDKDSRMWTLGPSEQTTITDYLKSSRESRKTASKKRR